MGPRIKTRHINPESENTFFSYLFLTSTKIHVSEKDGMTKSAFSFSREKKINKLIHNSKMKYDELGESHIFLYSINLIWFHFISSCPSSSSWQPQQQQLTAQTL